MMDRNQFEEDIAAMTGPSARAALNGGAVDVREGLRALNVKELLELQLKPREMLLNPILREKDSMMIYGWRGIGKTHFILSMAYAIASSGKFLRWAAAKPQRVIYFDGEMVVPTMRERAVQIIEGADEEPPDPDYLRIVTPDVQERPMPSLSLRDSQDEVDAMIGDAKVIIFDSVSTLFRGGRENEAESWLPVQDWALRLRRRGLCCIFLHHEGKGGAQRGTSRREDTLDTVIHLVRPADYSPAEGSRFEIHFEKARGITGDAVAPFEAQLHIRDGKATWSTRDIEGAKLGQAISMFKMGMTIRDVAEELKISKSAAYRLKEKARNAAVAD